MSFPTPPMTPSPLPDPCGHATAEGGRRRSRRDREHMPGLAQTRQFAVLEDLCCDVASYVAGSRTRGERMELQSTALISTEPLPEGLAASERVDLLIGRALNASGARSTARSRYLLSLWALALNETSIIEVYKCNAFGKPELGLRLRRAVRKGERLHELFFLLERVVARPEEAGMVDLYLNSNMQFNRGDTEFIGCGIGRLINHSCKPNVRWLEVPSRGKGQLCMEALEDIAAGEILWAYYSDEYFGPGNCRCLCPHSDLHGPMTDEVEERCVPPPLPQLEPIQKVTTADKVIAGESGESVDGEGDGEQAGKGGGGEGGEEGIGKGGGGEGGEEGIGKAAARSRALAQDKGELEGKGKAVLGASWLHPLEFDDCEDDDDDIPVYLPHGPLTRIAKYATRVKVEPRDAESIVAPHLSGRAEDHAATSAAGQVASARDTYREPVHDPPPACLLATRAPHSATAGRPHANSLPPAFTLEAPAKQALTGTRSATPAAQVAQSMQGLHLAQADVVWEVGAGGPMVSGARDGSMSNLSGVSGTSEVGMSKMSGTSEVGRGQKRPLASAPAAIPRRPVYDPPRRDADIDKASVKRRVKEFLARFEEEPEERPPRRPRFAEHIDLTGEDRVIDLTDK